MSMQKQLKITRENTEEVPMCIYAARYIQVVEKSAFVKKDVVVGKKKK